jgi:hypothetical protein
MFRVRLLIGLFWVLAAVAGHQMWTPIASPVPQPVRHAETTSISVPLVEQVGAEDASVTADPNTQPQFDVYGNQIDEAVGDYRVDPRGDMYEGHAPDTALLKLGPPAV